jgi:hypothetical protein
MANEVTNGTDVYVFINSVPVAHATSHTLTHNANLRPTSDKETGIYETNALGRFSCSAHLDGLVAYGSFEELLNQCTTRSSLLLYFGKKGTGVNTLDTTKTYASGYFYMNNWDLTFPDAANSTYGADFTHCSGFAWVTGL